MKENTQDPNQ